MNKDRLSKSKKNSFPIGHLLYRLRMSRMKGRRLMLAEEKVLMKIFRMEKDLQLYEGSLTKARCFAI